MLQGWFWGMETPLVHVMGLPALPQTPSLVMVPVENLSTFWCDVAVMATGVGPVPAL